MLFMNLTSGNTISVEDEKSIELMRRSKNYIEVVPAELPTEDETPADDETPAAPPAEPEAPAEPPAEAKPKRGRRPKNQE